MIKGEKQNRIVCDHFCQYHADLAVHTVQDCVEFWKVVQNLKDGKEIEFSNKGEKSINVIMNTTYSGPHHQTSLDR